MSATRGLPTPSSDPGGVTGSEYVDVVNVSFERFSGYLGGNAQSPSGVDAYVFDLEVEDGLTGHPDGMGLSFICPATNTAPVTFDFGLGAKAVVSASGDALQGGELVSGTAYRVRFWGDVNDHWRIESAPKTAAVSSIDAAYNNTHVDGSVGTRTWTSAVDRNIRIWVIGGGGSGATRRVVSATPTGGGAGGLSILETTVLAGDVITYTVGAGGASVATNVSGLDGGDTTASQPGDNSFTITALGGGGGDLATKIGGAGGSAFGGDINRPGGDGGGASANGAASGGGAVGLFGPAFDAVDVISTGKNGPGAGLRDGDNSFSYPAYIGASPKPFSVDGAAGGFRDASGTRIEAGNFCGGGGNVGGVLGGAGGVGGGGGACYNSNSVAIDSGAGGDGLVVIEYSGPIQ